MLILDFLNMRLFNGESSLYLVYRESLSYTDLGYWQLFFISLHSLIMLFLFLLVAMVGDIDGLLYY